MHRMDRAEYTAFLRETAHTMKVATVRTDGRPHIAPVWFALDSETIVFTTGSDTAKARHVRHNPWVSLCVDDERPPFSYVTVEGTATLSDDLDDVRHWATIIGGRYMGAGRAEEYGKRNGVPGELLVRVTPERVIAEANIAG